MALWRIDSCRCVRLHRLMCVFATLSYDTIWAENQSGWRTLEYTQINHSYRINHTMYNGICFIHNRNLARTLLAKTRSKHRMHTSHTHTHTHTKGTLCKKNRAQRTHLEVLKNTAPDRSGLALVTPNRNPVKLVHASAYLSDMESPRTVSENSLYYGAAAYTYRT